VWPIAVLVAILLHGDLHHQGTNFKYHRDWFISLGVGLFYCFTRDMKQNPLTWLAHFIADHSYGIYLSHCILLWLAFYKFAPAPAWFRWVFLVITSVGVPVLLYRYLERPMVLVGAHLARRLLHEKRTSKADSLTPMGTVP
jgi:peptidoglycan/LPS O-acetylase OafA/YrhL